MSGIKARSKPGIIDTGGFEQILRLLKSRGYSLVGPRIADHAVAYGEIDSASDLPVGWTDHQEPGQYRLERRADQALFGYVVGPQSWKKYLFPARQRLVQLSRNGKDVHTRPEPVKPEKLALIGVRSCELAAIAVQDRVFMSGAHVDPHYKSRRSNLFILAVNCSEPASTCFCTSMGTGPGATEDSDLALTEFLSDDRHEFLAEPGSETGASLLAEVQNREASEGDLIRRQSMIERAERQISRTMDVSRVKELLYRNVESPHWEEVAERCLSCANCTMVCPTCFCSTIEDTTDLSGDHAERWRLWDSCFTMDFSYIVGGSTRPSTRGRYRHWITHKLATWQDQFDVMGCVGCGRCITWCPVGIDITKEISALESRERASQKAKQETSDERCYV